MSGRDLLVAKFVSSRAITEIVMALPSTGASLLRIASFDAKVLEEALINYTAEIFQALNKPTEVDLPEVDLGSAL
jgi:hypothetical protein